LTHMLGRECGDAEPAAGFLPYLTAGFLAAALLALPAEETTAVLFGGRTLVWLFLVLAAAPWALGILLRRRLPNVAWIATGALVAWVLWSATSLLWAHDRALVWERVLILGQSVVFFVLLQDVLSDRRWLRVALWAYFLGASAAAIALIALAWGADASRAVLVAQQGPIRFAQSLGLALLAAPLLYSWCKGRVARLGVLVAADSIFVAMVFTGSRAAWVGLLVAVPMAWLFAGHRLRRLRWVLPCVAILAAEAFLLVEFDLVPTDTNWRMGTLFDVEANQGGSGRLNIWAVGWEMVKANPTLGVGAGNFPPRFEEYIDSAGLRDAFAIYPGRDPHSVPLSVLAELGPVGAIAVCLLFFAMAIPLIGAARASPEAAVGLAVLVFLSVVALASTIQYSKYFWFGCGFAAAIPRLVVIRGR
jgi:O-antigen ligase